MSRSDVYVTAAELAAGVPDIPYRAKSANAAREWCRSHGIVMVRPAGSRHGKGAYAKSDLLRVFEKPRSLLKKAG